MARFPSILVLVVALAAACTSPEADGTADAVEGQSSSDSTPVSVTEASDSQDQPDPNRPWAEERATWERERPNRYRLATRIECFCWYLPAWTDIVEGDRSVDHLNLLTGLPPSFGPSGPQTMESLYDLAVDVDAELETDPETGAIQVMRVDPDPDSIDDEWALVVDMVPLASDQDGRPPTLAEDVDPAMLTEPITCAESIGSTSADGTQALLVTYFETPPIEEAHREVALPYDQWEVRVVVGETPAGAGCDARFERARIAEAHAVGGRLTVTEAGAGVCDPIEIRIEDLEILDARGSRTLAGSATVSGVFEWACELYG